MAPKPRKRPAAAARRTAKRRPAANDSTRFSTTGEFSNAWTDGKLEQTQQHVPTGRILELDTFEEPALSVTHLKQVFREFSGFDVDVLDFLRDTFLSLLGTIASSRPKPTKDELVYVSMYIQKHGGLCSVSCFSSTGMELCRHEVRLAERRMTWQSLHSEVAGKMQVDNHSLEIDVCEGSVVCFDWPFYPWVKPGGLSAAPYVHVSELIMVNEVVSVWPPIFGAVWFAFTHSLPPHGIADFEPSSPRRTKERALQDAKKLLLERREAATRQFEVAERDIAEWMVENEEFVGVNCLTEARFEAICEHAFHKDMFINDLYELHAQVRESLRREMLSVVSLLERLAPFASRAATIQLLLDFLYPSGWRCDAILLKFLSGSSED